MNEPIAWASEFDVVVRRDHAARFVCVSGEVDMATAAQLAESIAGVCTQHGDEVVVDLRGVTFMDCSGVRVMINARKTADENGIHLTFLPSAWVVRVLELLELNQLVGDPSGGSPAVQLMPEGPVEPGPPGVISASDFIEWSDGTQTIFI